MSDAEPLWRPSADRIESANLTRFMAEAGAAWSVGFDDFDALYRWSVAEPEKFWLSLRDFAGLRAETWGERVIDRLDPMFGASFFPDARLNFAENLLCRRAPDDQGDALVFWGEDQVKRRISHAELWDAVARMVKALRAVGIKPGDRVAAIAPNMPETLAAMLAAAAIGAVWSSCSPDFGVQGILDRFGQIEPRVLFVCDGYYYGGKSHDVLPKAALVLKGLASVERTVVIPYAGSRAGLSVLPKTAAYWDDFTAGFAGGEIEFARLPFNHPLYVLYSSGTTGIPKCIVHGAGGTLLQHVKEHQLHCDIRPKDRVFYFTTCGWMMWNWLMTALASGATLLLYDGSPFHPGPEILFDYADAEKMTFFGTSAKFIDAVRKAGLRPLDSHDLGSVRALASTGSPLVAEGFDYVYDAIKSDVHLASVSGGTDLIGCFVMGNPIAPVWRGEIQTRALAMAVDVWDDDGRPLMGEKGELVCTKPFPSMPIGFWNDPGDAKYRAAYFDKFPGVWCHGDWIELTERGGIVIYGRSDATLNPGGVRIGTAEIYRQVEGFDEVVEAIVVGQEWDDDTRVVLFVRLRDGLTLDDDLTTRIKRRIRDNCSPRHVPARVLQVGDIPRTKSGKIVELAVREVIHGRPVKNQEALANPEALDEFADRPELSQ